MSNYNRHVRKNEIKGTATGILKKVGVFLVASVAVAGAVGVLGFDSVMLKTKIGEKNYTETKTVKELISEYQVNNPYYYVSTKDEIRRLPHNGSLPIYVYLPDEILNNEKFKKYAIDSFDYVFGIISKINPKYRYKIVSKSILNFHKALGDTTIDVGLKDLSDRAGKVTATEETKDLFYDSVTNKYLDRKILIDVDLKRLDESEEEFAKFVFTHELLHCFCLKDVYVNGIYSDTSLNVSLGKKMGMITPKDLATLCSLYMPKVDADKREAEVERLRKMIDDYSKEYYEKVDQVNIEYFVEKKEKDPSLILRPDDISRITSINKMIVTGTDAKGKIDYVYKNHELEIDIDGDTYHMVYYDDKHRVDSECSGKVIKTEHFIILENCTFTNGFSPIYYKYADGVVTNILIYDDKNLSKDKDDTVQIMIEAESAIREAGTVIYEKDLEERE